MHGWVIYGQHQQPHPYLRVTNYQEDSAHHHSEDRKFSESEYVQIIRIIRLFFFLIKSLSDFSAAPFKYKLFAMALRKHVNGA